MFFWNSLAFSMIQRVLAIWSLVSLAFSKSSLNIWKLTVHVLLKPGLENFEHYFASMWDECNCASIPLYLVEEDKKKTVENSMAPVLKELIVSEEKTIPNIINVGIKCICIHTNIYIHEIDTNTLDLYGISQFIKQFSPYYFISFSQLLHRIIFSYFSHWSWEVKSQRDWITSQRA